MHHGIGWGGLWTALGFWHHGALGLWQHWVLLHLCLHRLDLQLHIPQEPHVSFFGALAVTGSHELHPFLIGPCFGIRMAHVGFSERYHFVLQLFQRQVIQIGSHLLFLHQLHGFQSGCQIGHDSPLWEVRRRETVARTDLETHVNGSHHSEIGPSCETQVLVVWNMVSLQVT